MESLQLKRNNICSILEKIDNYLIKAGEKKVNMMRFDVGSNPNLYNVKLALAFERVLRTCLCDLEDLITDEFLEKTKLTINKLQ